MMGRMALLMQYLRNGLVVVAKKSEVLTEQDKSRNIPAHDKDTGSHPYNGRADGAHISQVFRRKKKRRRTISAHKITI